MKRVCLNMDCDLMVVDFANRVDEGYQYCPHCGYALVSRVKERID